jgi:hypothetical protein
MQPTTLPDARGKQGEIVVVMDRTLWTGAYGDSIRHYLSYPIEGLPAPEPLFSLIHQSELTGITQYVRNILMIEIGAGYEKASLSIQNEVYAKNQMIITIKAPSTDSIITYMARHKDAIAERFYIKDRDGYILYYKNIPEENIQKKVQEKFQANIVIPREYSVGMEKDDFLWLSREERDMIMGILLWKESYTAIEQLDVNKLLDKMDKMLSNVTGKIDGSYMATVRKLPADESESLPEVEIFPAVRRTTNNDLYKVQLNGLWQMENAPMGGPYVAVSMVDTVRGQIVTGVGFVFFPRRDKRDLIRRLEAILYTMSPVQ